MRQSGRRWTFLEIAAGLKSSAFPVQPNFNAYASNDFILGAGTFVYDKGGQVLKMIEGYLGEQVLRGALQSYLADFRRA